MRILQKIFILFTVVAICSSCGFSKIAEQIEVKGVKNIELKGMTGLAVDAYVDNDSRYNIEMSEAVVELYHNSKKVVQMTQIGESLSPAQSQIYVPTVWRLSNINPRTIPSFVALLSKHDYDDITISYRARFSTKGLSKRISEENVDLTKFMAIFAKEEK